MMRGSSELALIAGVALVGLAAGAVSGDLVVGLAVACALYAGRQTYLAWRLARALRRREPLEPPYPAGSWHGVFARVHALERRSRKRKRRLSRYVSRLQEVAAALPDAVVILGRGGRVEWCNPASESLLGLDFRGSIGARILDVVHDPIFARHLESEDHSRPLEMPAPGNGAIILSLLVTPFGSRRQRIVVGRDITRTYHLDQTRESFVANVSHELRTPLTVLSGHLEIMEESAQGTPVRPGQLGAMRASVERMRVLTDDLLTLSRLEMKAPTFEPEPVDVPKLLDAIFGDAAVLAAETGHALTLSLESDAWLHGNASELRSAFTNLLHNAIVHTPPRTAVTLRWYVDGQGPHLAVCDHGTGIPARHVPRLTERFFRVGGRRSGSGTGLGLAIVKHVLDRHGATLAVDSRVGRGSTFECGFPAALASPGPVADEAQEASAPDERWAPATGS
jgi:two-component system phosphate regulon sensor histidine kinase PhoR